MSLIEDDDEKREGGVDAEVMLEVVKTKLLTLELKQVGKDGGRRKGGLKKRERKQRGKMR